MGFYQQLSEIEMKGESVAVCIVISSHGSTPRHAGSKMLVYPDGHFTGSVGGGEVEARVINEALQTLQDGRSRHLYYSMVDPEKGDAGVCGGQLEVYVEPVLPKPEVLIVGGGHVGKALAHLAHWLGFRVIVSDDRAEFCTPEINPDADAFFAGPMSELAGKVKITPQTYIVLTTRGSTIDVPGLPALLASQADYIGVIGSRRRWSITRKGLAEAGISEAALARVHTPVGLDLHAETPEEIAVSIMAEIILLRNGKTAVSEKDKY
jgi:xanthine dehydrogenase accessory factor